VWSDLLEVSKGGSSPRRYEAILGWFGSNVPNYYYYYYFVIYFRKRKEEDSAIRHYTSLNSEASVLGRFFFFRFLAWRVTIFQKLLQLIIGNPPTICLCTIENIWKKIQSN
jgi:hypothetical protein